MHQRLKGRRIAALAAAPEAVVAKGGRARRYRRDTHGNEAAPGKTRQRQQWERVGRRDERAKRHEPGPRHTMAGEAPARC